ncbi:MAG: DUF2723 domain-containing protein [Kiritimatiellaeota bacterium]|nr:DUF2723 domain-containing protein [Kiritimatiellota bacterium]
MKNDLFCVDELSAARFFRREDWIAAIAAFVFSTFMFFHHMAPEVTLQDSGELVTGAFTFGVPHPPGYPLWALLGYVWSHFIVPFGNPAWRIGTMSVVTGGLTVGVMTLMMTRSTRILLHTLPWLDGIEERFVHWIALATGVSSALLFGFNRGVWLWASVSEMRVLNAFSFILIACLFLGWMMKPGRTGYLCATLLAYGLSLTNHQTVAVIVLALAAGTLAMGVDEFFARYEAPLARHETTRPIFKTLMPSLETFWEFVIAVLFNLAVVYVLFAWLQQPPAHDWWNDEMRKNLSDALSGFRLAGWLFWAGSAAVAAGWVLKRLQPDNKALFLSFFAAACVLFVVMLVHFTASPGMKWAEPAQVKAMAKAVSTARKASAMFAAAAAMLGAGAWLGWLNPRRALVYTLMVLCGVLFYFYMPFSASTNPPMNWGFASTKEGFLHAITRGQYKVVEMADPCGEKFLLQIWIFIKGLLGQYSLPLCLFGLVSLVMSTVWLVREVLAEARKNAWLLGVWLAAAPAGVLCVMVLRHVFVKTDRPDIVENYTPALYLFWALLLPTLLCMIIGLWMFLRRPGRSWAIFAWAAFLVCSLGLIVIINPETTQQEREITIKFFAPAHGFFAMLIGYGVAITLAAVGRFWKDMGMTREVMALLCLACLALPAVSYTLNWKLCALEKFDFGYQFGYRMFNPGGGYPDMPRDAVLFGGTDPGRFVPTYMIFCESFAKPGERYQSPWMMPAVTNAEERAALEQSMADFDRRDVYIITQNALADQTYMNYIRNHYDHSRPDMEKPDTLKKFAPWQKWVFEWGWNKLGRKDAYPKKPIRIPTPDESSRAFQEYVQRVEAEKRAGLRMDDGGIVVENGSVQVTGATAVMEINAILTQKIHEWNKDEHDFYIEESYPIKWMYPYLRPAGVIMKIEKEPLPTPQKDPGLWRGIIDQDTAYWDALCGELMARKEFLRSMDAQKNFSKLRTAIAGVYLHRGLVDEAVYALKQASALCPDGSEAGHRLAEIYIHQRKFDEARALMENYLVHDPYNKNLQGQIKRIDGLEALDRRCVELEKVYADNPGAVTEETMALVSVYAGLGRNNELWRLSNQILSNTNAPAQTPLLLGVTLSNHHLYDMAAGCFQKYLQKRPNDPRTWIELGWCHIRREKYQEGFDAWRKAVEYGREDTREFLRTDPRFKDFWREITPKSQLAPFRTLVEIPNSPSLFSPPVRGK